MAVRRAIHPQTCVTRARTSARLLDKTEMALLVIAVIVLLLVVGMWLRNVMLGGVPPVMATVTVKQGDTLWSLAEQYGDPNQYILERVNALVQANGLERSQALRAGQTLVIPVTNRSARLYYGGQYASREIAE